MDKKHGSFLKIMYAIIRKNLTTVFRAYPYSLLFQNVFNGALAVFFPLFAYRYVFQGQLSESFLQANGSVDYTGYIIMGQFIVILTFSSLLSIGSSLLGEIHEGTFQTYLLSPVPDYVYFIGEYATSIFHALIQAVVILLIGVFLGVGFDFVMILKLLFLSIIIIVFNFGSGILLMTIILKLRETYLTESTLILLIGIFSGVYYPYQFLPGFARTISWLFPTRHAITMVRNCLLYGNSLMEVLPEMATFIGLNAVIFLIAFSVYKNKLRKHLLEEIVM